MVPDGAAAESRAARCCAGDRVGAPEWTRGDVCRRHRRRDSTAPRGQSEGARPRGRQVRCGINREDVRMDSSNLLELAGAISSGAVRVIDLTFTLSPDFPVIVLPPEFGQAAPVRIREI